MFDSGKTDGNESVTMLCIIITSSGVNCTTEMMHWYTIVVVIEMQNNRSKR